MKNDAQSAAHWQGPTPDRPKSAKAILKKFLENQTIHDMGDVTAYVYEGQPGISNVLAVTVVPDLYVPNERWEEEWYSPTQYVLMLDLGYDLSYSLSWTRAIFDRGGLRLPEPGPWRYRGGHDGWTDNVPLAEVEFRIGQKQDDQADD
jgi:hypothetical protein